MGDLTQVNIGDTVQLRKAHPCGSVHWVVYRVGADIGLRCVGCGRTMMLTRSDFAKRVKTVIPKSQQDSDS